MCTGFTWKEEGATRHWLREEGASEHMHAVRLARSLPPQKSAITSSLFLFNQASLLNLDKEQFDEHDTLYEHVATGFERVKRQQSAHSGVQSSAVSAPWEAIRGVYHGLQRAPPSE